MNYRPISNLPTVSKVLERLVLTRLHPHLLGSANFSQFQSAYRKGHSTETALLEVLDRVYMAMSANDKQVTVLIGLHLSAAFDTVNHSILLEWLQSEFVPRGPDSVCLAGSASVTSREGRGQRSAAVCARASAVCSLLQPGG